MSTEELTPESFSEVFILLFSSLRHVITLWENQNLTYCSWCPTFKSYQVVTQPKTCLYCMELENSYEVQRHSQCLFKDILKIWYWIVKTGVERKKHFYLQKSLSSTIKLSSQLSPNKLMTTDKLWTISISPYSEKGVKGETGIDRPLKPDSKWLAGSSIVKIQTSSGCTRATENVSRTRSDYDILEAGVGF